MYPLPATDLAALERACAPLLALDEARLVALVPPQAGFWFGPCPHCDEGAQEHQIAWDLSLGEKVQCRFCKQVYPGDAYPENGKIEVRTPGGGKQVWRFHEAKDGTRYWFEARRWYEQRGLLDSGAFNLAQLYKRTGNKEAGRRAALILKRFAQVYPDYIVHYDYPHRPKQFFEDGPPPDFEPYRAAKWYWWAYADISAPLLRTYDLLADSEDLLTAADRARIEKDLFRGMIDYVARFDGARLTNMHPTTWSAMAVAANVLGDKALAEKTLAQMGRLIAEQFFMDGFFKEGTASYHEQTAGGLRQVLRLLYPGADAAALDARIAADYPDLARALGATKPLRLPDGRYAPLRDTWAHEKHPDGPPDASRPVLLPWLGYAILGVGEGRDQSQAHLNFTGRYGHDHFDSLSLLLFAEGKELYSDIGYTHSLARPWAMTTASHNTVVVDQQSQAGGGVARGRLLLFDGADPAFQVVSAEAPDAYPGKATTYRRTLVAVRSDAGTRYVVDIFDVAGGAQHDYLLHGSADEAQTLAVADAGGKSLPLLPVPSLLPAGYAFRMPKDEGDTRLALDGPWAYGLFRDVRSAPATGDAVVATFRSAATAPITGVRTWVLGGPGTEVATASAWAVRGIGRPGRENTALLDDHLRRTLLIRRSGPTSRFVAVHCPFSGEAEGEPGVRRVTRLPLEPGGVALKIEHQDGGTDYLLFGGADARPRTGSDGSGLRYAFDGPVALINGTHLKMLGGTRLTCGGHTLTASSAPVDAPLLNVSGQELTLAGEVPAVSPGAVITIRHGDGTATPFHVASVRRGENGNTILRTREPAAFTGSPDGPLTLRHFPKTTHPGPHRVRIVPRWSAARR